MADFKVNDVLTLESGDGDEKVKAVALQRAINSGMWSLQGSYGRAMMGAIEAGRAMLGPSPAKDAYDNRIPSRTEVEAGSKGSRQFVVNTMGEDWAKMLEDA